MELSLTMSILGPIYRGMKQSLKIYQTNEIIKKVVCNVINASQISHHFIYLFVLKISCN